MQVSILVQRPLANHNGEGLDLLEYWWENNNVLGVCFLFLCNAVKIVFRWYSISGIAHIVMQEVKSAGV